MATVFLGSGLLFVAMLFVASAVTAGFLAETAARSEAAHELSSLGPRIGSLVLHIYAMRMAAVFTISTATIGLRTGFLPRWLALSGTRPRRFCWWPSRSRHGWSCSFPCGSSW